MPQIFTIVISLQRSETRRAKCKQALENSGLNWEFLDAIDGLQLTSTPPEYHEEKVKRLLGFPLSASEIGCFLSHRLAWAKCIEKNCLTLVLEDDFSFAPHFSEVLDYLANLNQNWDLIRLQGLKDNSDSTITEFKNLRIVENHGDPLGATAYLIKPTAAIRLIRCSQDIYEPLDHFIEHQKKHSLKVLAVKPYPVISNMTTSTIHDRPERKPIQGLRKVFRSIARAIDRYTSANPWFPK